METRYFWCRSDGKTVEEISWEEWRNIVRKQLQKETNTKLLVRVHPSEVFLIKGNQSFWIPRTQLEKTLQKE